MLSKEEVGTVIDPISTSIWFRLLTSTGVRPWPALRLLFFLLKDFAVSAEIKTMIPNTCSRVQVLSNSINERKSVVALRAVEVIDIVNAPKFFVIAAEHEDPKKPIELKS